MLLVLLIISLLLILIIPNIMKQTAHIQSTGCNAQVKMVNSQIEAYALKHNRNPSSIDELVADGFIKEAQKHVNLVKQYRLVMEKLLQIRKQQAFTLIEMVVVMMIVSCFLLLSMTSNSLKDFKVINDESNIISLITELNYIKSKAIANQSFINVRFYENSDTIKVVEKNKIYYLKLKVGKIINVAKVDSIYFDKHGNINKFGSISIEKTTRFIE